MNWRDANHADGGVGAPLRPQLRSRDGFLAASQQARDAELAEKESLRRRELVRTRRYNIAVTIALIVALALGGFAFSERNAARRVVRPRERRGSQGARRDERVRRGGR